MGLPNGEGEGGATTPRSPEAQVGMHVEDLWDTQAAQLSPTDKLNACFEGVPVSDFPVANLDKVIEIRSDTSLADAVKILAENKILSAPVVNVDAPEDASWTDRYLGMVEFAGIVVWILHQSKPSSPRTPMTPRTPGTPGSPSTATAMAAAANGLKTLDFAGLLEAGPDSAATSGDFFEALTSSEFYKSTQVKDIVGSFRWAPFLALQNDNTFLTMLLLLSKYKMKSVPVVDIGDGKINSIITQAAVIHMLAECVGFQWFESWGTKKLSELGLPLMTADSIVKVYEDEPVLRAFKLMRRKKVGGLPVIESGGSKPVGNISLRDVQFLLIAPEIYHSYRSITAKNFLTAVRSHLHKQNEVLPVSSTMVSCKRDDTIKDLILKLDREKIHRVYVVDDNGNLEGVITLRDIISRLVHEPRNYFGDFFDGILPLPQSTRV